MAKLTFTGPTREADRIWLAELVGDATHVHMLVDRRLIYVYTAEDVQVFDPRPTVSKWQFVQACADAGITEAQLNAAAALLTPRRRRFWESPRSLTGTTPSARLRTNILPVPTPSQWNAIFLAAAALDPLTV
ncbi:MAG: hypothetical protein IPO35_17730 [Uliginosibacterium sp.]|nr:hypothetical protein [Uliginosibacterium sp.]